MDISRSSSIRLSANGCDAPFPSMSRSRGILSCRPTRAGSPIDVTCDNLARAADRCRQGKAWVSAILFGSESEFAGGEPGQIEKTIVASEGLHPKDFIIPEIPRISSKGTRREILAPVRTLDAQVGEGTLSLSFDLTRGSYATCLVREFTKSE